MPDGQAPSSDEVGPATEKRRSRAAQWWHDRYEGSAAQDLVKGLDDVEFGNWIILFGASFLLSVLPLILLLSAFANSRVDDNIDTRLGLSHSNAHVVDSLFKAGHAGWGFGVVLALIFSLAGTIAVARSIQKLYQQIFGQPDVQGWANVLRCFVWALAAALEVYVDALVSRPLGSLPAGRVFLGVQPGLRDGALLVGSPLAAAGKGDMATTVSRGPCHRDLLGRPGCVRVGLLPFHPHLRQSPLWRNRRGL